METERKRWREWLGAAWAAARGPVPLLLAALVFFGWLSILSASWRSGEAGEGRYLETWWRQLLWIGTGIAVFFACAVPHYLRFRRWAWWIYGAAIAGLLLVFVAGTVVNGSRRWIVLGPVQVQPSEFAKIAAVIALARVLRVRKALEGWRGLLPPVLLVAVPMALIVKEPDLGTALLLLPAAGMMLLASGAPLRRLALAAAVGAALVPISYFFLLHDYQVKRVNAFLTQRSHSGEQKIGEAYQLIQSKIAVGSGGTAGKGWGRGTQNTLNFTPFRHTDFIFAVIGEEWGFAGASAAMALFLLLFALSISIASRTREPFGRILVVGLVSMLSAQVCINVGMALGLLPVTGVTLPFVSYGGSSMVASFAAMGLIANVGSKRVPYVCQD
jgi:rod shape determining protein RodA